MPVPVSRTAIFNCWPAGASARVIDTSIDPPSVLTEFSIRFDSTWRSSLRSERIVRSCGSTCCAIAIRLAAIFAQRVEHLGEQRRHADGFPFGEALRRAQLDVVGQILDERLERQRGILQPPDRLQVRLRLRAREQDLDRSADRLQRRAQLVADHPEERVLCLDHFERTVGRLAFRVERRVLPLEQVVARAHQNSSRNSAQRITPSTMPRIRIARCFSFS